MHQKQMPNGVDYQTGRNTKRRHYARSLMMPVTQVWSVKCKHALRLVLRAELEIGRHNHFGKVYEILFHDETFKPDIPDAVLRIRNDLRQFIPSVHPQKLNGTCIFFNHSSLDAIVRAMSHNVQIETEINEIKVCRSAISIKQ